LLYPSLKLRNAFENKKILDLGSGCGMTAMATAMAFPTSTVIASDLPDNVRHLEKMIKLNNLTERCSAMALDWNAPDQLSGNSASTCPTAYPSQSFDVIIGCEVVYHEPILLPLLNTVDYHLKPQGLLYLISARHRHCYLQLFYELQQRGYEVLHFETLSVPYIPAEGCFAEPEKIEKELEKIRSNVTVYRGQDLGCIRLTPSEELSVGWFSEGEFLYDMDKLIMVTVRRR
jgi:cyclopropane fatty-acyl-phospholipid synthase-like methyltransferase